MANKRLPVEAYPSELLVFLRLASLQRVEIPATAAANEGGGLPRPVVTTLVARINALRTAMKEQGHPLYDLVAKASISKRILPDGTYYLIGQPRDQGLLHLFHEAGIHPEELPDDPLAKFEPERAADEVGNLDWDDFLSRPFRADTAPPVEPEKEEDPHEQ